MGGWADPGESVPHYVLLPIAARAAVPENRPMDDRARQPAAPSRWTATVLDDQGAPRDPEAARRALIDELAAARARERYRHAPMAPIEARGPIANLLGPDERLLAVRPKVLFDLRQGVANPGARRLVGELYLTSLRLILIGPSVLAYRLDEIGEVELSGDRLFLSAGNGADLALDADWPRLLREQFGAARAGARQGS